MGRYVTEKIDNLSLGKGEVVSSILTSSINFSKG